MKEESMLQTKLINLINKMITEEIGLHNTVYNESKTELLGYIRKFNKEIDQLIFRFIHINSMVDNGGVPVLKKILKNI